MIRGLLCATLWLPVVIHRCRADEPPDAPVFDSTPKLNANRRDGQWTAYDDQGRPVARGEYRHGRRHGRWTRWFQAGEGEMFASEVYAAFEPPFSSEADFVDGVLTGTWTVQDAQHRTASRREFENGQPHGTSTCYFVDGSKREETLYEHGRANGTSRQWNGAQEPVDEILYLNGRVLRPLLEFHATGQRKCEGAYLLAGDVTETTYDWWRGISEVSIKETNPEDQKYGVWTWWYPNGQEQLQGRYEGGVPVGKFTWWHANGQKQLEGSYAAGKPDGKFVAWHSNGQKALEGHASAGEIAGKWLRWSEEGTPIAEDDSSIAGRLMTPTPESVLAPAVAQSRPPIRQTRRSNRSGRRVSR